MVKDDALTVLVIALSLFFLQIAENSYFDRKEVKCMSRETNRISSFSLTFFVNVRSTDTILLHNAYHERKL
jgi:hypothetical protein